MKTCFEIREIWLFTGCPTDCPVLAGPAARAPCSGMGEEEQKGVKTGDGGNLLPVASRKAPSLEDLDRERDDGNYQAYWGKW